MIRLLTILFLLSTQVLLSQNLMIRSVSIIDVETGQVMPNQDISITGGVIREIKDASGELNEGDINGEGYYLIPGLIDAHIHLFQSGGLYTRPDAIDLRDVRPYDEEIAWCRENAQDILRRYLACGITTTIDVGGPMHNFKIRDSLNLDLSSATIYLTGPLISTYQPKEFQIADPPIIKVDTPEEARSLVQRQLPYQPDFIKIWYIALKPQDALDDYPIIEATIQEAHLHDLPVAVHATELTTAKLALKAGADYLVHSVDDVRLDQEFVDLVKTSKTVISPTLIVSGQYDKAFLSEYEYSEEDFRYAPPIPLGTMSDLNHLREPELIQTYKAYRAQIEAMNAVRDTVKYENYKKLVRNQIPLALGTDAGNIGTMHASSYYAEIRAMQARGISNQTILKSATIDAARSIQKENEIGSIAIGKQADLVLLRENPLANIMAIQQIESVIHQGIAYNPSDILLTTPELLVQHQLNAYNGHHLKAFLAPYAEDVKIYQFPDELIGEGKAYMENQYQFIEENPDLHCELRSRIILGNTIIDHERVIFDKAKEPIEVIAVYKVIGEKISEVYFIDN